MNRQSIARTVIASIAVVPCAILLLPAFLAAAVLFAFASGVRALGRLLEPRFVPWTDLIAFDPHIGWKPKPNMDAYYLAERDDVFHVVTDGEGWPGRRSLDDSPVVVIGDSFAFGYGVNTDESFAQVDPALPIKGVGSPGYSMVHGVLLMESFAARLRGKLVVWLVYPENDLQDNLAPEMRRYRAPFARAARDGSGWEIERRHITAEAWQCSNLDTKRLFPHLCVPGPLADRAYAACDYLIERAQRVCAEIGATLVVVTVPHPMQFAGAGVAMLAELSGRPESCDENLPDRRIGESCARRGVPMIAGKDHLSVGDYKRREGIHWNARGHRRMAQVLARVYGSFTSGDLNEFLPREAAPRVDQQAAFASAPQAMAQLR